MWPSSDLLSSYVSFWNCSYPFAVYPLLPFHRYLLWCLALPRFIFSYQMSSTKFSSPLISKYSSPLIQQKLCKTKQVMMVFEKLSLLVANIANMPLHLNFSITNTRSTVTLAEDKCFLKFLLLCWKSWTKHVWLQKPFWQWS